MNWTLEVVCVPVTDVDRAKQFYAEQLGFVVDIDDTVGGKRAVQLTPPGSGCSIAIGTALTKMKPGSLQDVQFVVRNLKAARQTLVENGVEVSNLQIYQRDGTYRPATEEDALDYWGFIHFQDPDGNGWAVQQISDRP